MPNTITDAAIIDLIQEALQSSSPEQAAVVEQWTLESSLSEMGVSSIVALEMAGYIEEKLEIQFADDELARIMTIQDLVALIQKQKSAPVIT